MKARHVLVPLASAAIVLGTAAAGFAGSNSPTTQRIATQAPHPVRASLQTSSPQLAACFPHARAKVIVDRTTDTLGKDTLTISARGLKPRTDFTVFLLEQAGSPFGAAEYLGDFTTDANGRATNSYQAIVEEAFAFNNVTRERTDLNAVGFWFADSTADDSCLGDASPVTGFDGDGEAGVQMMNSGVAILP